MYCNTNKSPELLFSSPHSKPHGARGLSKHYHLRFDQKLGMGVCEIIRVPCACVACTSMIDKPWISGRICHDRSEERRNGISSDVQGLSIIDVQATQAHDIRRIAHNPIPIFGSKTQMIMLTQPSCAMRVGIWTRK